MPLTRISLGTAGVPRSLLNCRRSFMSVWWRFDVPSADRFQFIERAADAAHLRPALPQRRTQRPLRAVSYFRRKTAQPGAETGTLSSALRAVRR